MTLTPPLMTGMIESAVRMTEGKLSRERSQWRIAEPTVSYVWMGGGTREVSSYFDDGDVWEDRHVLSCPTFLDFILPHSPFLFLGRNIHRTIKRLGPPTITLVPYKHNLLNIRRKEMRMTDRNSFQSA
jgi:hypothetical protein